MASLIWLGKMDQASSGTTPTNVLDTASGTAVNLPITYGTGAWTSIGAGKGLNFSGTCGAVSAALNGTKLETAFAGATQITFEVVVDLTNAGAFNEIFGLGDAGGTNLIAGLLTGSAGVGQVGMGGPGSAVWYDVTYGLVHLVGILNTPQATNTNRNLLYANGASAPMNSAPFAPSYPTLNQAVDSGFTTWSNNRLGIGCLVSPGTESLVGPVYFAAVYSGVLAPAEISAHYAALTSNNDADPNVAGLLAYIEMTRGADLARTMAALSYSRATSFPREQVQPWYAPPKPAARAWFESDRDLRRQSTEARPSIRNGADLWPLASPAKQVRIVQQVFAQDPVTPTPGTTISVSLNVKAGSALHVYGTAIERAPSSCADDVNGAYGTPVDALTYVAQFSLFPVAAGLTTVTLTYSAASTFKAIWVVEIENTSGVQGHAAQEQSSLAAGTDVITSGTAVPTALASLVLGLSVDLVNGATPPVEGTGFASSGISSWLYPSVSAATSENKRITSTSPIAATFSTPATNHTFDTLVAIYGEAQAGATWMDAVFGSDARATRMRTTETVKALGGGQNPAWSLPPLKQLGGYVDQPRVPAPPSTVGRTGNEPWWQKVRTSTLATLFDAVQPSGVLPPAPPKGPPQRGDNDPWWRSARSTLGKFIDDQSQRASAPRAGGIGDSSVTRPLTSPFVAAPWADLFDAKLAVRALAASARNLFEPWSSVLLTPPAGPVPLLLYLFNESATGTGPAAIRDTSSGTPLNATITYGASAQWTAIGAGDGLDYAGTGTAITASLSGTKVQTALAGTQKLTIEIVIDCALSTATYDSYLRIVDGSSNALASLTVNHAAGGLLFSAGEGNSPNDCLIRYAIPTSGILVIHVVIDTPQANPTDRAKLSIAGAGVVPTVLDQVSMGVALDTGFNWSTAVVDIGAVSAAPSGKTYYAAVFPVALTPSQIAFRAAALAINNDADPGGAATTLLPWADLAAWAMPVRRPSAGAQEGFLLRAVTAAPPPASAAPLASDVRVVPTRTAARVLQAIVETWSFPPFSNGTGGNSSGGGWGGDWGGDWGGAFDPATFAPAAWHDLSNQTRPPLALQRAQEALVLAPLRQLGGWLAETQDRRAAQAPARAAQEALVLRGFAALVKWLVEPQDQSRPRTPVPPTYEAFSRAPLATPFVAASWADLADRPRVPPPPPVRAEEPWFAGAAAALRSWFEVSAVVPPRGLLADLPIVDTPSSPMAQPPKPLDNPAPARPAQGVKPGLDVPWFAQPLVTIRPWFEAPSASVPVRAATRATEGWSLTTAVSAPALGNWGSWDSASRAPALPSPLRQAEAWMGGQLAALKTWIEQVQPGAPRAPQRSPQGEDWFRSQPGAPAILSAAAWAADLQVPRTGAGPARPPGDSFLSRAPRPAALPDAFLQMPGPRPPAGYPVEAWAPGRLALPPALFADDSGRPFRQSAPVIFADVVLGGGRVAAIFDAASRAPAPQSRPNIQADAPPAIWKSTSYSDLVVAQHQPLVTQRPPLVEPWVGRPLVSVLLAPWGAQVEEPARPHWIQPLGRVAADSWIRFGGVAYRFVPSWMCGDADGPNAKSLLDD